MSIITNENLNALDTAVDDVLTKNYSLEILSLKNPADFRKFSRSFVKIDKIMKDIEISSKELATKNKAGIVKIGENLIILEDGTIDVLVCSSQKLVALVDKYKGIGDV
ncbi:hypothetical protein [Fusobacterium perfoetens]|uniref:hypothetical protein n=1 Tax=Fusobacterium perfoetens TaxID=852 RepID=UPI001F1884D6|nr:hypothetical protein [Fusobacterium perfoetens]MCF2612614.1 hypothetical protein [Fusobacterium perfoetens]